MSHHDARLSVQAGSGQLVVASRKFGRFASERFVYRVLAYAIPESPRYLIAAQRLSDARRGTDTGGCWGLIRSTECFVSRAVTLTTPLLHHLPRRYWRLLPDLFIRSDPISGDMFPYQLRAFGGPAEWRIQAHQIAGICTRAADPATITTLRPNSAHNGSALPTLFSH